MLDLTIFATLGVWVLVGPAFFMGTVVNGNHIAMAVVIGIGLCWQMLCLEMWLQMLLLSYSVLCCGRWKATVGDVLTTCVEQVAGFVARCGRWNSHMMVVYFYFEL